MWLVVILREEIVITVSLLVAARKGEMMLRYSARSLEFGTGVVVSILEY